MHCGGSHRLVHWGIWRVTAAIQGWCLVQGQTQWVCQWAPAQKCNHRCKVAESLHQQWVGCSVQGEMILPSDLDSDSALNGDAVPPKQKKKTRRGTLGHRRKRAQHINGVRVTNPKTPVQLPDQYPSAQEVPSEHICRMASKQNLGMQRPPQQQSTLIAAQHMPPKQMHPQQNHCMQTQHVQTQCMQTPFAAHASQTPPFQHCSATQRMWAAVLAHLMSVGHCQVGQPMANRQETAVGQQQHGHMAGNSGQFRQDWPRPHGHVPCNRSAILLAFPFMQLLAFQHRLQYQQQRPGYQYQQQHLHHQNQQQHQPQQQYQPKQQYQPQQQYPPKQQYQRMQLKEMYHPQEFQVLKRSSWLPSQRPAQNLIPARHHKPLVRFAVHDGPKAAMKDSKPGMPKADMSQEAADAFTAQIKDDHVLILLRYKPSAVQRPEAKHSQVEGQHPPMQQRSCTPGLVGNAAPPLPAKQQPNAIVAAQQSLPHRQSNPFAAQEPKCSISGTPFDMFGGLPSHHLVFHDMINSQYADWLHRARGRQRLHRK